MVKRKRVVSRVLSVFVALVLMVGVVWAAPGYVEASQCTEGVGTRDYGENPVRKPDVDNPPPK